MAVDLVIDPATRVGRYKDLVVTPAVNDEILASAYFRYKSEGTLDTIFYQGVPSLYNFMTAYLQPERTTLGCFHQYGPDDHDIELCGLGWVGPSLYCGDNYKKAETGVGFFRKQRDRRNNILFGKMMMAMFFNNFAIDALHGTTPIENKLAVRYAEAVGFKMYGPIPNSAVWKGKPTAAWVSSISKAEWLERGD
jgi:hypothetical protein